MRMTDPPELDAVLRERDAAEAELAKQHAWMCERYGYRGVPAGAPEQRENERLQGVVWDAHKRVREVTEKLKEQTRWDDQIELNRDPWPFDRRALWADRLGMRQAAANIREHIDVAATIADRMERCPNNPRNGGDGCDRGDGKWVDRRPPPEWACAEFELGLEPSAVRSDPLARDTDRGNDASEREQEREAEPDCRVAGVDPLTREDVERER